MPKKDVSPLKTAQREGDSLKKKVDENISKCKKLVSDSSKSDKSEKIKAVYERSVELETEVKTLLRKVEDIKEEDERVKISDFNGKKKSEISRLQGFLEDLKLWIKKFEPDDVEEEYLRKASEANKETAEALEEADEELDEDDEEDEEDDEELASEDEEEEEEDYDEELDETVSDEEDYTDDEEDETEYDETMTMSQGATVSQWEALMDFEKDEDADLPMKKGEVVTIINMRDDGWWEAENEKGERGWVPSTYLMVHSKYKDLEEPEENNNVADNTMTVPRINLPTEEDDEEGNGSPKTPKSGKVLWSSIKKAVKETSVTDVLHAMGAVPSGFRQTTLGRLHKDDLHRMKNYLAPKLSPSCLSFKDLFFNPSTNRIRARTARLQKVVTLQVCRQIPNPGSVTDEESSPSVEVESRHIRICLFDGVNVLSNIHNIRISTIDKDQRTWNFNAKMTDNMRCLEFGEFFVRTNSTVDNIGILFELCISYRRVNTGEYGEFSCGWAHLPLYENGAPIQNKAYDMLINGGTPYEKGVEVDPSIGRRANANRLRTLMSGNKQPRLVVKISQPKQEMKEQLDMLPDVLVSSTAFLPFLAFYRQILADALLRDRPDMQSAELIHSPFLAMFAEMIEQPDVMDAFRGIWLEKLKNIKRADKRDNETLKEMFGKVFVETIFPLANMVSLPALMMGDLKNEAVRAEEINKVMKIGKSKKAMLAALLSPDITYTPFDIKEVSFDVLGPYCTTKA